MLKVSFADCELFLMLLYFLLNAIFFLQYLGKSREMRAAFGIMEGRGLSFLLCEFNPVERKIHFWENWLIFLGIWGEPELILRIWGAKEKYFRGPDIFFMDFGRSMHYFQGSREHRPLGASISEWNLAILKFMLALSLA